MLSFDCLTAPTGRRVKPRHAFIEEGCPPLLGLDIAGVEGFRSLSLIIETDIANPAAVVCGRLPMTRREILARRRGSVDAAAFVDGHASGFPAVRPAHFARSTVELGQNAAMVTTDAIQGAARVSEDLFNGVNDFFAKAHPEQVEIGYMRSGWVPSDSGLSQDGEELPSEIKALAIDIAGAARGSMLVAEADLQDLRHNVRRRFEEERIMNRACALLTVLSFGFSIACGSESPQKPVTVGEVRVSEHYQPEHWNETVAEAGRLYREGHPEQSLAVFQRMVDANPKFADGYFSLAGNYVDMANDLERDPTAVDLRKQYLEQAAVNYEKFHDLTADADDKAQGSDQLVNVFGPRGLKQIDKAVRYARRYVEERPTRADGYGMLAAMLREQGDHDRATAVLVDAKAKISTSNRDAFDLAQVVVKHVKESPALDPATAARFLAEASAARDRLLSDTDSDWRALGTILKTDILDTQPRAK